MAKSKFKFSKKHRAYWGKKIWKNLPIHKYELARSVYPSQSTDSSAKAFIYRDVFDYISRCILDYPNIETGGQLFGFYTQEGYPVVVYAIGPGPHANHQTAFFNQDVDYLMKVYKLLHSKYGLCYIGEWHSHHRLGLAKPSGYDGSTVVGGMQKNNFNDFLLCIGNLDKEGRSSLNAFTFSKCDGYSYRPTPWKVIEIESPYRVMIDYDPELVGILCHPRIQNARHGENFLVAEHSEKLNYRDGYWFSDKPNRRVLKAIIDYLANLDRRCVVTPKIDESGIVRLDVQRNRENLMIVFGEGFPQEAPMVMFSDGSTMIPEWEYKGSIYDSFVEYYNNFALAKLNNNNMYNV